MDQSTQVSPLHVREKQLLHPSVSSENETPDWQEVATSPRRSSLLKNLAVASALVLCAVTLRTGALPTLSTATDAVITAATDQSLLDDQLGKLSFVSSMFPEAVLVFGESRQQELALPVSGGWVVHAWSEAEPYLTMRTTRSEVLSAAAGEVIGIYHGNGDEKLVQVFSDNGLTCLYGNLGNVDVAMGEYVTTGHILGHLLPGEDLVFEARSNGYSIDPASCFQQ